MPKGIFTAKRGKGKPFEIGHKVLGGFKKGNQLGKLQKGKKKTKEHIEKLKNTFFKKGDKRVIGENNYNWKGGTIPWKRRAALERDNYTCRICGLYEPEIMQVHHVLPRSHFKDKILELENLITLCPNCHSRENNKNRKIYNRSGRCGVEHLPEDNK